MSAISGSEIFLKYESSQFTASFKERGALWKLLNLSEEDRKRGVIAVSRGNHAQGVAYHAKRLGIAATIVMPIDTPTNKVAHTEEFGARVVLHGTSLPEASAHAGPMGTAEKLTPIHPYDDPWIITGQGTVGLEMLEDVPELEAVVIPVGGGGLISGSALAIRHLKPEARIYGVQADMFPSMHNIVHGLDAPCAGPTIAEGIAVTTPGNLTQEIVKKHVDDILLVSERDIEQAMALLVNVEKTVAEGAGAASLAAVLRYPDFFAGKRVGVVISGGNVDSRLLAYVLLRDLARDGRLLTLSIESHDQPGFLGQIAAEIGKHGGNIIDVTHNRLLTALPAKSADIRLTIETRDADHSDRLVKVLKDLGLRLTRIEEL